MLLCDFFSKRLHGRIYGIKTDSENRWVFCEDIWHFVRISIKSLSSIHL